MRTISVLFLVLALLFDSGDFATGANRIIDNPWEYSGPLPGTLERSFTPPILGTLNAIAVDAKGNVLASGLDLPHRSGRLVRLNENGQIDPNFNPVPDTYIFSLAIQPNGKILAAGSFKKIGGGARNYLARLNRNGTLDPTFQPAGIQGTVYRVLVQPNGKILATANFEMPGGLRRFGLVRLNTNGALLPAFAPPFATATALSDLALQADGRIVVVGDLRLTSGRSSGLLRLNADGTLDPTFPVKSNRDDYEYGTAVAIQADGKVLVAKIGRTNNRPWSRMLRLLPDGTSDPAFNLGLGLDGAVSRIRVQPSGHILISGWFTTVDRYASPYLARLRSDGRFDTLFYTGAGPNEAPVAMELDLSGNVVIAGSFNFYDNAVARYLAKVTANDPWPLAPKIVLDSSEDLSVAEGRTVSFTNRVIAAPEASLRWNKGVLEPIAGQATEILTLRNVRPEHSGYYSMSATNSIGSARSLGFHLEVLPRHAGPGAIDLDFFPGTGPKGTAERVQLQSDGKVLVSGRFVNFDGFDYYSLVRLDQDGSVDTNFIAHVNRAIFACAVAPDDKIYVSSAIARATGIDHFLFERLNSDGSLDANFTPELSTNSFVHALVVQRDGRLIVAGDLRDTSDMSFHRLMRLNIDGAVDSSFAQFSLFNPSPVLALQPDGKLIICTERGGRFDSGIMILRLNPDGTSDNSFFVPGEPDAGIASIALQPDGKVLLGGAFRRPFGRSQRALARLNSDGSVDHSFAPRIEGSINSVRAIAVQENGKILLAGYFETIDGIPRTNCARLNPDGTLDVNFDARGIYDVESIVSRAASVFVAGRFFEPAFPRNGVTRLLSDDGPIARPGFVLSPTNSTISAGAGITLHSLASGVPAPSYQWYGDGFPLPWGTNASLDIPEGLILARVFYVTASNAFGVAQSQLATVTTTNVHEGAGRVLPALGHSVAPNGRVLAAEPLGHFNSFIIAGEFTYVDEVPCGHVARINLGGTLDPTFASGAGANGPVYALRAAFFDQDLFIAGAFTHFNGVRRNFVAMLRSDGTLYEPFDTSAGPDGPVRALALEGGLSGRLWIAGDFSRVGGVPRQNIARLNLDGSLDVSVDPGAGFSGGISSIVMQPDGKLLVAGLFRSFLGVPRYNLARLNPNGSLGSAFAPRIGGEVETLVLQPDGKILIAGSFREVNGTAVEGFARLNSDGNLDSTFSNAAIEMPASVQCIALQDDHRIQVGGTFFSPENGEEIHLLRLYPDGTPDLSFVPPRFEGDFGFVNIYTVVASGNALLVGGAFTSVNGLERPNVAAFRGSSQRVSIARTAFESFDLKWDGGWLQEAAAATGPWADVTNAHSPLSLEPYSRHKFYRLRSPPQ